MAGMLAQVPHRERRYCFERRQIFQRPFRIVGHGHRAARTGILEMLQAVVVMTAAGEEQMAGMHCAAVHGEAL